MKKFALILAALALVSTLAFTACEGNNNPAETAPDTPAVTVPATTPETKPETQPETKPATEVYTIKVVDETGAPVAGVTVQMCIENGSCLLPVKTDANGIATYQKAVDPAYVAKLTTLPDGYTGDSDYHAFDANYNVTITITKN